MSVQTSICSCTITNTVLWSIFCRGTWTESVILPLGFLRDVLKHAVMSSVLWREKKLEMDEWTVITSDYDTWRHLSVKKDILKHLSLSLNIFSKDQQRSHKKIKIRINEGINRDSNVLHSLIRQKCGTARDYGKGEGVVVDLLPGVDSSGASIPSGSMEP